MKHAIIRIRVGKQDMSGFKQVEFGWEQFVYGNVNELIPDDTPQPMGLLIVMITFVDANLMHDVVTGRPVIGILHFLNRTPIDYYSKRQSTIWTMAYVVVVWNATYIFYTCTVLPLRAIEIPNLSLT